MAQCILNEVITDDMVTRRRYILVLIYIIITAAIYLHS